MKKKIKIFLIVFLLFPIMIFFDGCSCNAGSGNGDNIDKTYLVNFYTNSYITFDLEQQEVKHGGYVLEPKRPTTYTWINPQDGIKYTCFFVGWYKGFSLKDEDLWNFSSDVVTENITLVAKWDYIPQS